MIRLDMQLNGMIGNNDEMKAYWKQEALKEIAKTKAQYDNGEITIDDNGIARNCIGRVVTSEVQEKLCYAIDIDAFSQKNTNDAREYETAKVIANYKAMCNEPTFEQKQEMKNTFGEGNKIVDVLSGKVYNL